MLPCAILPRFKVTAEIKLAYKKRKEGEGEVNAEKHNHDLRGPKLNVNGKRLGRTEGTDRAEIQERRKTNKDGIIFLRKMTH